MIKEKFSKGLKLAARLALVLFLTIIAVTVVVTACSIRSANTDVTIQTEPTFSTTLPVATEIATEPLKIDEPILFTEITYTSWYDIDKSKDYVTTVLSYVTQIEVAMESGEYTDNAYSQMFHEVQRLYSIIAYTESDIRHYETWEYQHYYAAKTWEFLMNQGFSAPVASAIIGNMMVETGGGTLDIDPLIYNPTGSYYGLCQWSVYYYPFMANTSFEEQLNFLLESMPKEFKEFGFCYKQDFTYEDFLAMDDPEQAALAFAKVYERCGSASYNLRKQAAIKAYRYFVYGEGQ